MKIRGLELWLLGALFLGPLLLAVALYYGPWLDPHELPRLEAPGRHLFDPPLALPPLVLEPHEGAPAPLRWSLVYATMARCDAACTGELERLRAVHLALGRRADRVRRVLIAPAAAEGVDDPALWTGRLDANDPLAAAVGAERLRDGEILIIDPLGNVVLAYRAGAAQQDLLDDMKRLLEVSRIG